MLAEVQTLKGRRFGNLVIAASARPAADRVAAAAHGGRAPPGEGRAGRRARRVRARRAGRDRRRRDAVAEARGIRLRALRRLSRVAAMPRPGVPMAPARPPGHTGKASRSRGEESLVSYIRGYDPETLREKIDPRQCKERLDEIGEQREPSGAARARVAAEGARTPRGRARAVGPGDRRAARDGGSRFQDGDGSGCHGQDIDRCRYIRQGIDGHRWMATARRKEARHVRRRLLPTRLLLSRSTVARRWPAGPPGDARTPPVPG